MNAMTNRSLVTAFAATLSVASLGIAAAAAQPASQHVISRGAIPYAGRASAAPRIVHDISGAIVSIHANMLGLRLRNGRTQPIDATDAFASGRVSAPLFLGKLVAVTGSYDARHVMLAETITRVPRVDASTPRDR